MFRQNMEIIFYRWKPKERHNCIIFIMIKKNARKPHYDFVVFSTQEESDSVIQRPNWSNLT
jgi:hypothetical protein